MEKPVDAQRQRGEGHDAYDSPRGYEDLEEDEGYADSQEEIGKEGVRNNRVHVFSSLAARFRAGNDYACRGAFPDDHLLAFFNKLAIGDDIHLLANKERTQEEFFHTFNALYDSQKQIVITSDCPPREIPTLQERLHSRFEWGLIADIQPPDVETKIAILRKKAEFEGVDLPDEVAYFIASNVKSNIRELEGSLVRLSAYSSLTGERITLELAEQVLRNVAENALRVISIERIQKVVADFYSLKVTEIKAKNNSRRVAEPRQMAMYLCRELTDNSLPQIGKEFGGKHHTTVLHSIRKIANVRKNDPKTNSIVKKLSDSI